MTSNLFLFLTTLLGLHLVGCGSSIGPSSRDLRAQGAVSPGRTLLPVSGNPTRFPGFRAITDPVQLPSRQLSLADFRFVEVKDASVLPPPFKISSGDPIPKADPSRVYTDLVTPRDHLEITINDVDVNSPFYVSVPNALTTGFVVGPIEVDQEGILRIPYLRDIRAIGKSLTELSVEIAGAAREISPSAEASIRRTARLDRRVFIYGEVEEAGAAVIDRVDYGLLEALANSGGPKGAPHLYTFVLHRDGATYRTNVRALAENRVEAQDADVLKVEGNPSLAFHVTGVLRKPGRYPFPDIDSTVMDAVAMAEGMEPGKSSAKGVFVFRSDGQGGNLVYGIDLTKGSGMFLAQNFSLNPNDVIYVSESSMGRWERATINSLPVLGSAAAFAAFSN